PSRSCEFPNMLLRALNLALDKLRLSTCCFLQVGGQGELSRVFEACVQALLPEREHLLRKLRCRRGDSCGGSARSIKKQAECSLPGRSSFSASSRSSAGTSNLGSVIVVPP